MNVNTPENYAKQIKNAKRHIEKREKTADVKHIRAKLKRIKKELNAMECGIDELPLYRAGFQDALNEALTKIDEVLK